MLNEKKVKPMPGHDFEKKVQQQMEGLNVTPSKTVWNRVEIEIRREKRRRRVLIALPILLLLLGGGIYLRSELNNDKLAISSEKQKTESHDKKNSDTDPVVTDVPQPGHSEQDPGKHDNLITPPASNDVAKSDNARTDKSTVITPSVPGNSNNSETTSANDVKSKNNPSTKTTAVGKQSPAVQESIVSSIDKQNKRVVKPKPEASPSAGLIAAGTNTKKNSPKKGKDPLTNEQREITDRSVATNDADKDKSITDDPVKTTAGASNSAATPPMVEIIVPVNPPMKDKLTAPAPSEEDKAVATTATKKTPAKPTKWSWGITGGIGVTRVTNGGLLDAFGGQSQMMDAALFSGNTFNPTPTGLPQQAAEIKPGMNYNVGAFIERSLTKNLSVSAGLQYNYFSTYSDIGKRVDSQRYVSNSASTSLRVDNYYRNGQNNRYTSSYHFIELPVTLNVRLGGNKKTTYYWNSGFSIGQLLATNALHYDGQSGFYYGDNSLFRKTQWSLHTELAIRLFSDTKNALEIGPHFNYQPSNLLKQTTTNPQHLLSGGLKVRWYMGQLFK